jgi:CDP-diacylglycerol--glycerol-3-phosphate 3-phosphatidyltransferase
MAKIFGNFKGGVRAAFDPMGRALIRFGVSPDAVTVAGTAGVVASSVIFGARGHLLIASLIITAFCLVDVLDGAMARVRGYGTKFGALLDSSMDRIADAAIFGSLAWYLATTGRHTLAAVAIVCLGGAQIVSYVKARAEGLGFAGSVGIAERMERLILIGIGGLLWGAGVHWGLTVVLWLLAVLTLVTIAQRLLFVRGQDATVIPLGDATRAANPQAPEAPAPNAQTSNGQTSNAQTSNGQTSKSPTVNTPIADAPIADAPTADGQTANGQTANGQTANGQTTGGQTADRQTVRGLQDQTTQESPKEIAP